MAIPSIYINLDDDVSKVVARLKHQTHGQIVLVCPKRCFLFSDSVNLKLLKKQTDLLGKEIFILTMDEKGQAYAAEAGFELKYLPAAASRKAFSDIKLPSHQPVKTPEPPPAEQPTKIKNIVRKIIPGEMFKSQSQPKAAFHQPPKIQEPKVEVRETIFPQNYEDGQIGEPKKSHTGKMITGVVAVSLILLLLLVFVILPKAVVVVYPKTEPVTRDMEINISVNAKSLDPTQLVMPAAAINETVNVSGKFQSQGKSQIGNKASGTVKIYNFTKLPINLKSATTILSVAGKNYSLVNDITDLKPTTYSNARTKEVDRASLGASVVIVAQNGGDDSNLPQGTRLEISNQVFGSRPQLLYAVSDSEISGGTTRYLSIISQDDLNSAKAKLEADALKEVKDKLALSGGVLADGAYVENVPQFTTDNPVAAQTPTFEGSMQAVITGLSFKSSDLSALIYQRIGQTLDPNKTLAQSKPADTAYTVKTLDLNNGLAVLQTHFEGQAVYNVDLQNIVPQLEGKSQTQVNEILQSKAAIQRVDIILAPSWQKNFPFFAGKINVSIGSQAQ